MTIKGGCLCKAVRYEISAAKPLAVRACWCRTCQYIGAGNATVNAVYRKDAVKVSGATSDFRSVADSGSAIHRRFCPACGTHLFSEAEPRPHLLVVRVGTLDDPSAAPPGMTIWTDAAPRWACLDAALPATPGQPPPAG